MNIDKIKNIKTPMQSLKMLVNKRKRKRSRKIRDAIFMKQQKHSLKTTLKQDKIYRQGLENFHEQMFNSTMARSSEKYKTKSKLNNHLAEGTNSQTAHPIVHDVTKNVRIVISKLVMEPVEGINGYQNKQPETLNSSQASVALHDLNSSELSRNKGDCLYSPNILHESLEEKLTAKPVDHMHFTNSPEEFMNNSHAENFPTNELKCPNAVCRGKYLEELMNSKDLHAERFFHLTRMTKSLFNNLSELVSEELLAITLTYLAEGVSLDVLSEQFGVSESDAQQMILVTSKQLLDGIKHKVLNTKPSYTDFYETALQFQDECDLPNCVGAIDARCIISKSSLFQRDIAIDILATCRPNFQFAYVEIVQQFDIFSRRDVLNRSKLMTKFATNIPTIQLPNSSIYSPGFFVAPKSFPNTVNIITQSIRIPGGVKRRLIRGVNVIDMAFALLKKNWKCLDRHDLADKIDIRPVWLVICLHNYILMNGDDWLRERYCPNSYIDQFDDDGNMTKGKWRADLHQGKLLRKISMIPVTVNRGSKEEELHEEYFDYLLNEGRVEWQQLIQ